MSATPAVDAAQRTDLPLPSWTVVTEPFWLAAGKGQLVVQRCSDCRAHRWPPSAGCYNCASTAYSWEPTAGTGTVFSYTWADFPPPADGERNIAVIELDGVQGEPVRMTSWVLDVTREGLVCGLPVEVTFLPVDDEAAVPAWRPRR